MVIAEFLVLILVFATAALLAMCFLWLIFDFFLLTNDEHQARERMEDVCIIHNRLSDEDQDQRKEAAEEILQNVYIIGN